MVPVHEVAKTPRLIGLHLGPMKDVLFAGSDELGDPEQLDVSLGSEAKLSLQHHLHPQALAVEAILVALLLAEHGVVPLPEILVSPAPGVMHSHGPVGRYWPIHERETVVGICVPAEILLLDVILCPEVENLVLNSRHIETLRYLSKHPFLLPSSPLRRSGRTTIPPVAPEARFRCAGSRDLCFLFL